MAVGKAVLLALLCGVEGVRVARRSDSNLTETWKPKLLPGQIDVKRPAFLFLDESENRVVISQFGFATKPTTWNPNPFPAASSISQISLNTLKSQVGARHLSGELGDEAIFVSTNEGLKWPNVLSRAPAGYGDYIVVPDGFLPPTKEDGELYLANPAGKVAAITSSEAKTFYHEVEWHDFNGDGLLDILTARCTKSGIFSFTFSGELVWLENPGKSSMASTLWKEHIITTGPDVIFKSVPYKDGLAVFTTEFFNPSGPKLSVHFLSTTGVRTGYRVIDDNLGKPFAVDIVDLDGDGSEELLVTNHQGPDDEILPAVFAYEVNWSDLKNGAYPRHTLTYGPSKNKVEKAGVGAPGFAHGFYPRTGMSGPKYIFAAGDGAFDVWILKPKSGRFQYDTEIIDINGTTGQILEHDYDGDGVLDLLIPDNDYWKLHVITFE